MSTFPYTQTTPLVNSINATTVVSLQSGMQVSKTTFITAAGPLGEVTLSPVEPVKTNITLAAGTQKMTINVLKFQAAFGFDDGSVFIQGDATNQEGTDPTDFSKVIAQWTAP